MVNPKPHRTGCLMSMITIPANKNIRAVILVIKSTELPLKIAAAPWFIQLPVLANIIRTAINPKNTKDVSADGIKSGYPHNQTIKIMLSSAMVRSIAGR